MTWSDPIVDEVRRVPEAYAARFNYDPRAICRDLKEQEKRSGRKLVSCATKTAKPEPNRAPPSGELGSATAPVPSQRSMV